MRSEPGAGTIHLTTNGGHPMQVTALADALVGSRHPDGGISLHDLQSRLSRAGLEEFARAVAALARRVDLRRQDRPVADRHPWL
jgi:hypothetical protein